jgi:hypothetical protein
VHASISHGQSLYRVRVALTAAKGGLLFAREPKVESRPRGVRAYASRRISVADEHRRRVVLGSPREVARFSSTQRIRRLTPSSTQFVAACSVLVLKGLREERDGREVVRPDALP